MEPSTALKVLELCKVAPPPPSPGSTTPTSLPLTFFDMFWLKFPPTQRLFFYQASHLTSSFLEIVLPKLKQSLSHTLHHYLPLVGNLTWHPDSDKPILQYVEGDAISLTVAKSEADFYQLSGDSFCESKEFHPFLPCLFVFNSRIPALTLQVTLFPNAGFSIGYAAHHGVMDGKNMAMFMHTWASMCRRDENSALRPELTPFYDRTIINDPCDLEERFLNFWMGISGTNNKSLALFDMEAPTDTMLGTFQMTQENIENIKKWVQEQQKKPAIRVSSFAITTAYTWVCLVKTRQLRTEKVHLGINVDCRDRLEPPVPSTYFGNCITVCFVDANANELVGEDGVAIAAKAIGAAIGGLSDGVLKRVGEVFTTASSVQQGRLFSIAGSPRFEFYDIDFGWGTPRKVKTISIEKTGAFSLSDSRDGKGGIEIGIVLKRHETEDFASLFASGLEFHKIDKTINHS